MGLVIIPLETAQRELSCSCSTLKLALQLGENGAALAAVMGLKPKSIGVPGNHQTELNKPRHKGLSPGSNPQGLIQGV